MKKTQSISKVLLLKDTIQGRKGQVVSVKSGFFRNYLAPNNLAVIASGSLESKAEKEIRESEEKFAREMKKRKKALEAVQKEVFKFKRKAKSNGELYGSVSADDIRNELEKEIEIRIPEKVFADFAPIKNVGAHKINLSFGDIEIGINVDVMPEKK